MSSPGDEFLHRLLTAHGAEDAFAPEREDDPDDGVGDPPQDGRATSVLQHFDAFGAVPMDLHGHRFVQASAAA